MNSDNSKPAPPYDEVLAPSSTNWLDITTPSDYDAGMKVFLNTLTHKVVSFPFTKLTETK